MPMEIQLVAEPEGNTTPEDAREYLLAFVDWLLEADQRQLFPQALYRTMHRRLVRQAAADCWCVAGQYPRGGPGWLGDQGAQGDGEKQRKSLKVGKLSAA